VPVREQGTATAVVEAQGLRKTFATGRTGFGRLRVSAVDGVDLAVHAGDSLGIVGESGCGKSTLARLLVGLESPDEGTITVAGHEICHGRRLDRKKLGRQVQMVFQDPYTSLNPRLTVFDIVSEPLVVHRLINDSTGRRNRVVELLDLVGLGPESLDRFPHQFSGGQRQRIGIARALALGPRALVCDEPVSALDVSVQAQVVNLLRDLQHRTGIALIFIAHDLSLVRHVADRVAVMYLGRIAEVGDTDTIYHRPRHPYTQALLSAVPSLDRSARRLASRTVLDGEPPSPADPPSGCRFRTRCWLAQDSCAETQPLLRSLDPSEDRSVACHFA
jgi:oligopeptide transport system ATP-binding protein